MFLIMININLMLFFTLTMISIIMGISSSSILFTWISLEINLMSFIPMMIFYNKKFNDSFMKYFLIQSIASSIMLIFFSLSYIKPPMNLNLILLMMIFLKMGTFPFYLWYINMLKTLSWMNCLILMTMQKILIFFILKNLNFPSYILNWFMNFILLNMLMSIPLIFNTSCIKTILGASSMTHTSWLMLINLTNLTMWINYFLFYTLILLMLIIIFNIYNYSTLKTLIKMNYLIKLMTLMTMILMMMMPPMMTFFIKMFTTKILITALNYPIPYLMLLTSIMFMYFYIKLLIPSTMQTQSFNLNKKLLYKMNLSLIIFMFSLNMIFIYYIFIY